MIGTIEDGWMIDSGKMIGMNMDDPDDPDDRDDKDDKDDIG